MVAVLRLTGIAVEFGYTKDQLEPIMYNNKLINKRRAVAQW